MRVSYIRRWKTKASRPNTNAAAALAAGEYLALTDHDDVLAPHAVYEMMKAAHETGAGVSVQRRGVVHFGRAPAHGRPLQPDFAPDYLNCCNYICHFSVFQKALFDAVGGLDPACDGSQDHDLFLKLSERAVPVHVPKVLYYWRVHAASTSGGTAAKPYVEKAAQKAVADHARPPQGGRAGWSRANSRAPAMWCGTFPSRSRSCQF